MGYTWISSYGDDPSISGFEIFDPGIFLGRKIFLEWLEVGIFEFSEQSEHS